MKLLLLLLLLTAGMVIWLFGSGLLRWRTWKTLIASYSIRWNGFSIATPTKRCARAGWGIFDNDDCLYVDVDA